MLEPVVMIFIADAIAKFCEGHVDDLIKKFWRRLLIDTNCQMTSSIHQRPQFRFVPHRCLQLAKKQKPSLIVSSTRIHKEARNQ